MRTLFLMAILATLLVIANKKPDQTAWEAARELKQDAQDVIAEVKKETIIGKSSDDVADQYANFEDVLHKTLDGKERSALTKSGGSSDTRPTVGAEKLEPPIGIAEANTPPEDRFPEPSDAPEKAAPPPDLPKLPNLSAAPTPGAPFGESERPGPSPVPPSQLAFRKDYGDVRSDYERASRFLAEIK